MKRNITYVISSIGKALAFEWISTHLNKEKFNLNFILLNPGDSDLENFLKKNRFAVERVKYSGKKDILKAIYKTHKLLKKYKTEIIHTHLFDANIVGLTAAWLARVPKRIHTRHHSDYHHIYHPHAVKYDKRINRLSTDIVAISNVVKTILVTKEHVNPSKIHLIHHGFQLSDFINANETNVKNLKQKYITNHSQPVVGVVSRYLELKGIQYVIPAFKALLNTYPDALLILSNTNGNYRPEIRSLLQTIPEKNYIEIQFESDIFSLYKLFDVFIHVPIAKEIEAFGQTYVEALAAGIPSIFTLSGIANEFICDRHNALVVPYKNSDEILNSLVELLKNKNLALNLIRNGEKDVISKFGLDKMIFSIEQLYEK